MKNLIIIDNYLDDPAKNIATDEFLFNKLIEQNSTQNQQKIGMILKFYGWKYKFCSIGISQRIKNKTIFWENNKKNIVRRPTGGGIVFHDFDICFGLVADTSFFPILKNVNSSYNTINLLLLNALAKNYENLALFDKKNTKKGNYTCFENPVQSDVMLSNQKIIGGAQKRINNFLLHEGSINLPDFVNMPKTLDFIKNFSATVVEEISNFFEINFETYEYSPQDLKQIDFIFEKKYNTDFWNRKF